MYHANVNVSLMVQDVTGIKSGITVSASVNSKIEKNVRHLKIFWFMTLDSKLLFVEKQLRITFNKTNGFIRVYDGS